MRHLSRFFLVVLLLTLSAASWAEWKTLNYNNGTYVGNTLNGQPHGHGTFTFHSGERYVGEYTFGIKNGQGTNTWPGGHMYVGKFRGGNRNGQGTYTWPDGHKEVGDWKDDQPWNVVKYDKSGKITGRYSKGTWTASSGSSSSSSSSSQIRHPLTIRANVNNASLYIDGTYQGKTPNTTMVKKGRRTIKVTKSGYKDYVATVNVTRNTTHYATLKKRSSSSSTASTNLADLTISANVSGTSLYIDGNYRGKITGTSTGKKVSKGRRIIKVTKSGYEDYIATVNVWRNTSHYATLKKKSSSSSTVTKSGYVYCLTKNSFGGKFINQVTRSICSSRSGTPYSTYAYAKRVLDGRNTASSSTASTNLVNLRLNTNVRDTSLYIDGKYRGTITSTSTGKKVSKGRRIIKVTKSGYEDYIATVNVTRNTSHYATLKKKSSSSTAVVDSSNKKKSEEVKELVDASLELQFWRDVTDSDDPDMYRAYLEAFPDGAFVPLAKVKLKKLTGTEEVVASTIPELDYGRYYALVIGNNNYEHLSDLQTAVNDANKVASVLEYDYGFEVDVLKNATRSEILKALSGYRKTIGSKDNLLIYYAGHGNLDAAANEGYWLPVDAEREDDSNWLLTDRIVAQVRAMEAKHVMVIADSCFSGTIIRAIKIEQRSPDHLQRMVKKKSRTALTSGGLEPVMDSGSGGKHSAFAASLISLLEENTGVLDASQLFSQLRPKVMVNSPQTPEYGDIHQAGHDGGDFLFVRR